MDIEKKKKTEDIEPAEMPDTSMNSVSKKAVRIRSFKTRIFNPKTNSVETYNRGDVIKKPWPELLELAENDKKHNTLIIIKIEDTEK